MTTHETALFLTAGMVSGICPFILSAYSGGSMTIILQIIAGPLAAIAYRGLSEDDQPDVLALSLCAGLMLLTAVLFRINRGQNAISWRRYQEKVLILEGEANSTFPFDS